MPSDLKKTAKAEWSDVKTNQNKQNNVYNIVCREEKADLRAKVYLLEKEKAGLKMILEDRDCMEEVLRTRIQHLEEILDPRTLRECEDQVLNSQKFLRYFLRFL